MAFNVSGSFPASIIPSQNRMALSNNYLDFTNGANDFAQQYLPELYEQEVERYGNRTLSGFLRMVGAEMPMTSDQVVWSEQNRLHIAYKSLVGAPTGVGTDFRIEPNIALPNTATSIALRKGNTILMSDNATGLVTQKFYVKDVLDAANAPVPNGSSDAVKALITPYDQAGLKAGLNTAAVSLFVYGSEFGKGTFGMEGSIEPEFTQYNNKPIIIKDKYEINGSDTAQIGWVEVATEDGTSGYLWYLKAQSETRLRFDDYLEMAMVEAEDGVNVNLPTDIEGSEGMFAAIEARGNVYVGFSGAAGPGSGAIADFDEILKNLDKQGAIEENMLFLSRQTALDFDD